MSERTANQQLTLMSDANDEFRAQVARKLAPCKVHPRAQQVLGAGPTRWYHVAVTLLCFAAIGALMAY